MRQRCPVCKTHLWTDPFFTPAKLRCPRCNTEFRPMVAWGYFRVMLVILVLLGLLLIRSLAPGNEWLYLFLLGLALCLWLLPKIINLENIGPTLTPSEGVLDPEQLRLKLEDSLWEEEQEEQLARKRFRDITYIVLAVILGSLLAIQLWRGF